MFLLLVTLAPCLLAGVFDLTPPVQEGWGVAGAWVYPVGSPYDCTQPASLDEPGFIVRRTVGHRHGHQGADLSNRAGGGAVRAAAAGLVVRTEDGGWNGGYGSHAVLAHRDAYGSLSYTVYAHMEPRSLRVRAGDLVHAGQPLGLVGRSGRASAPHLHFEVRLPSTPDERWENARVVDPLIWVQERLPLTRSDSTWARPYLEWAERAGMLAETSEEDRRVRREVWWRMVSAGFRGSAIASPASPESLAQFLSAEGLIAEAHATRPPRGWVGWDEIAADLDRARVHGMRTGLCETASDRIAGDLARELGPLGPECRLSDRTPGQPTVGRTSLLLAQLAAQPEITTAVRDESPNTGPRVPRNDAAKPSRP